jgi:diguanylate cyclase (GGDEF)-like protein
MLFPGAVDEIVRWDDDRTNGPWRLRLEEAYESRDEAEERARTDALTRLPNRPAILAKLFGAVEDAYAQGRWISFAFLDIDHFKAVNEEHGHPVGDIVLHSVGGILLGFASEDVSTGRFGGEEFVIVMLGFDAEQAIDLAEQIRGTVEAFDFPEIGAGLTVSIGVATDPGSNPDMIALYERADAAVRMAKKSGRNRVHRAPPRDTADA